MANPDQFRKKSLPNLALTGIFTSFLSIGSIQPVMSQMTSEVDLAIQRATAQVEKVEKKCSVSQQEILENLPELTAEQIIERIKCLHDKAKIYEELMSQLQQSNLSPNVRLKAIQLVANEICQISEELEMIDKKIENIPNLQIQVQRLKIKESNEKSVFLCAQPDSSFR